MQKRRWSDLSTPQRVATIVAGTVQIGLLIAALRDLYRRPARHVNGDKRIWAAICFINFFGPIAYLKFGRKR